jgi:putative glutamine amidotransferase
MASERAEVKREAKPEPQERAPLERPRVGVGVCLMHPDPQRDIFRGKALQYIEERLARSLWEAGMVPVALPDLGEGSAGPLLELVDGLVLMGGADVAPGSYGEEPIESGRWPGDRARDIYELRLLGEAAGRGLPLLGVCRGCQLINVAFGGTLYQDLRTQLPDSLTHRDPERYDTLEHETRLVPGTWIQEVYGKPSLLTNSIHHQGLKDIAPGFAVSCLAPDGVVEGIERVEKRGFIAGIQWHPEFIGPGGPGEVGESGRKRDDGRLIFRAFAEVCRQRAAGPRPAGAL